MSLLLLFRSRGPAVQVSASGYATGAVAYSVEDPRVQFVKYARGYFSAVRETPVYAKNRDESLEQEVEEITEKATPAAMEGLADALRALGARLARAGGDIPQFVPPSLYVPSASYLERVGDLVIERPQDDEDDEILLMMLLQ